jgi:hypothetical protein
VSPKAARLTVVLETGDKRVFASAADWPGWSRSGKSDEAAIEALVTYAPRYAPVAKLAGFELPESIEVDVVERNEGGGGTDFGVPSRVTDADAREVSKTDAERLAAIVKAAWTTFDRVAAGAPAELRKGPRGGGRDRDKMVGHVMGADSAYAREIGLKAKELGLGDRAAYLSLRVEVLDVLRRPSDGSPLAGRRWTARYAAHRITWHALDHAWEMQDRSEKE